MTGGSDEPGATEDGTRDQPPDRPFARDAGVAPPAAGADKAEPEKASAEIAAGDVADELADFA